MALSANARARRLTNDGQAPAARVVDMFAEADGSQVADLPHFNAPIMPIVQTAEPVVAEARQTAALLPRGSFVPFDGLDHAQPFVRSDLVLPHVYALLAENP